MSCSIWSDTSLGNRLESIARRALAKYVLYASEISDTIRKGEEVDLVALTL